MSKIYIFVFIMMLIAYLSPKEGYRKLFQFFVGGVMAVMLIFPIIQYCIAILLFLLNPNRT